MDGATIAIIIAGIVTIIGAVTTSVISIIKAIRENTKITVAGQQVTAARGKVRDKKVQEIHILTNSRLTAALNLVMVMAKREADRTGKPEDLETYKVALAEVKKAEEATEVITLEDRNDEDLINAKLAEDKLHILTNNIASSIQKVH